MPLKHVLIPFLLAVILTGCATLDDPKSAKDNIIGQLGFVKVDQLPNGGPSLNPVRLQALREAATTLGARGSLAFRSIHINASLDKETKELDRIFDFNRLLLKHNVLPPVVAESQGDLNLDNDDVIRMADKTYKIIHAARFVTAAPTWRSYIWLDYKQPNIPDRTLLPRDKNEGIIWNYYLKKGWESGIQQANDIFSANLNRLKRDYLGMVLYRKLLAQGMITSPIVSKADLGITGNSDEIRVNDEVIRITERAKLQPNSEQWQPVLAAPVTKADVPHEKNS